MLDKEKSRLLVYLHFGNQSTAIIRSYVIDKLAYLQQAHNVRIRLIAFISLRHFWANRARIKALYPHTVVLPHFPRLSLYPLNILILLPVWLVYGQPKVMAKNVYAAALARYLRRLGLVRTIVYDAEGATYAEREEFGINKSVALAKVRELEQQAIRESELVRTVSHKMADYWKDQLNVTAKQQVVIPCTLSQFYLDHTIASAERQELRRTLGYQDTDIIFIYAGSFSPWQGFDLIDELFTKLLARSERYQLILLSDVAAEQMNCARTFPHQVNIRYVASEEVVQYLSISDYGLLLRRPSLTNKVAAPTKFAEYLACGLEVLISPGIGDYSDFSAEHDCGVVVRDVDGLLDYPFTQRKEEERERMRQLAMAHFTNDAYREEFTQILEA